jgi:hypothetical protein
VKDNSPALRVKMLDWLNSSMQDVWSERSWLFLEKTVDLAIVAGAITLPTDFGDEIFVRIGNSFIFTTGDNITPSDATRWDVAGGDPHGYTTDDTSLVFHPAASGTASLTYTAKFPAAGYADDTTNTIFPTEFTPLFERAMLTAFYEYDVDTDRAPVSIQIDQQQLRRLKKLDNQRRPLPQLHSRGYVRTS